MQPEVRIQREFRDALAEMARRIADSLQGVSQAVLPIRMYIAGGTALHVYTGSRVSNDVDAAFSRRIALPEDLEVAYRDSDGLALAHHGLIDAEHLRQRGEEALIAYVGDTGRVQTSIDVACRLIASAGS